MKSIKPLLLFALIIMSLAMLSAYLIAKKSAENKLQSTLEVELLQIVNKLQITLERHSYLPSLLADNSEIRDFLRIPKTTHEFKQKQENINLSLEHSNNISGTSTIFLMDPSGEVIASSNWAEKESLIHRNFSSQPYFKQASQNTLGRYFSSETRDSERYYYFAQSVSFENNVIGVITVQVPLSDIASNWVLSDIDFAVTDKNGIVFLSSKRAWDFNSITKSNKRINDNFKWLNEQKIDLTHEGFQTLELLNIKYLMLSQKLELADWHIRVLSRYAIAQKEISKNLLSSAILIFLVTALTVLLFHIQNQRKKYQQQAREELENKVIKRTQALKKSQEDLIQAAKMAALGQLSAGITHEINNPLSAIRAYTDNANQFLQKDRLDMVAQNLSEITKLTENMASITGQLKSFSRKSKGQLKAVNLSATIKNAMLIVHSKVVSSGTSIDYKNSTNAANEMVLADEIWLSQILVNLISNAISATNQKPERNVHINVRQIEIKGSQQYCIEIRDNGTGIEESNLPRIFEPFFTTKSTTKGLGLGLSISFNLAKDMNGSLDARNRKGDGALFTLYLPSA